MRSPRVFSTVWVSPSLVFIFFLSFRLFFVCFVLHFIFCKGIVSMFFYCITPLFVLITQNTQTQTNLLFICILSVSSDVRTKYNLLRLVYHSFNSRHWIVIAEESKSSSEQSRVWTVDRVVMCEFNNFRRYRLSTWRWLVNILIRYNVVIWCEDLSPSL